MAKVTEPFLKCRIRVCLPCLMLSHTVKVFSLNEPSSCCMNFKWKHPTDIMRVKSNKK